MRCSTLCVLAEKNGNLPASLCKGNPPHIHNYKTCCRREAVSPVDGIERKVLVQNSLPKLQITKNRAANEKELTCSNKQEQTRTLFSAFRSDLTLPKVQQHSALGFSSRPNLGNRDNERSHFMCPLHRKISSTHHVKCFIFQKSINQIQCTLKLTESLPQALLGFGLGYVF